MLKELLKPTAVKEARAALAACMSAREKIAAYEAMGLDMREASAKCDEIQAIAQGALDIYDQYAS